MSAELAVMELTALLRAGTSAKNARHQFQIASLSNFQKQQFDFIWSVATDSGGGLTKGLDRLAEVFAKQNRQLSELKIAFASPKATANLILFLPLLAVLFSELLGLSVLAASVGTSLGVLSVGLGLILLIIARVSSLRMLESAKPRELDPGAFLDAISIALSAGLNPKSFDIGFNQISKFVQQFTAFFWAKICPGWKCFSGGFHGQVNFALSTSGNVGKVSSINRGGVFKGFFRFKTGAIYEVPGVNRKTCQLDPMAHGFAPLRTRLDANKYPNLPGALGARNLHKSS
jgi:Flp pilus assembly protein TadB